LLNRKGKREQQASGTDALLGGKHDIRSSYLRRKKK